MTGLGSVTGVSCGAGPGCEGITICQSGTGFEAGASVNTGSGVVLDSGIDLKCFVFINQSRRKPNLRKLIQSECPPLYALEGNLETLLACGGSVLFQRTVNVMGEKGKEG